jgi:hypothetical protein
MYGSSGFPESARLRIDDDIRRAEAHRRRRMTRRGAAASEHARAKSIGRTVLAVVLWPIKH